MLTGVRCWAKSAFKSTVNLWMKMYRHRKWKKTKMTNTNTKKQGKSEKMRRGELYMRGSDGWMEGGEGCRETA
jgi:hypothetical protein